MRAAGLLLGAALAAGCAGVDGSSADGPSNLAVARNFDQINSQVLQKNCTFSVCHAGAERAAGSLDLTADPYGALVSVASVNEQAASDGLERVKPCDPGKSFLLVKLELAPPGPDGIGVYGENMPKNNPSLPPEQIQAIADWIARGAKRDEPADVMGASGDCTAQGSDGGVVDAGGGGDGGEAVDLAQPPADLASAADSATAPDLSTGPRPDLAMLPDLGVICPTLEKEPDDFYNVANALCLGTGIAGTIDSANDADWYSFRLQPNDDYTVALTDLPWDYTFNVYHVDSGNLTLYFSATDFHDLSDQVEEYLSSAGGTYLVKVYSYWGDSDAQHPYRLTVTVK